MSVVVSCGRQAYIYGNCAVNADCGPDSANNTAGPGAWNGEVCVEERCVCEKPGEQLCCEPGTVPGDCYMVCRHSV